MSGLSLFGAKRPDFFFGGQQVKKEQLADNVTLYCGDSREVVPTLGKIDAVVSDPPYGIEELVGGYGRAGGDKTIANDKNLRVVTEVMALARKQLRNGWLAAFYSCRITPEFMIAMLEAGYHDYFGEMVWDKRTPGLGTQIRYQHENVAFFRVGKPIDLTDSMSVFSFAAVKGVAKDNTHPHEKPDRVMDCVVGAVPGKMILDPFMGTGSTGAAAVRAKRGFVGIELNPKYFE